MIYPPTVVLTAPFTDPPGVATPSSNPRLGEICKNLATPKCVIPAVEVVVKEKLFSFTVGNDVETSSGKSALEICWETLERVQCLNRRITLHNYPEERIERSNKFHHFLIRVAGIAGGDVAASKAMGDPRFDRRVRDYLAEHECPNYLIESFRDVPADGNATLQRTTNDKPWSAFSRCIECGEEFVDGKGEQKISEFAFCGRTKEKDCRRAWLAKHKPAYDLPKPEARFHQVTPEDVAWGERQGLNHTNPSAAQLARYEEKLLKDVAAYRAKDQIRREMTPALERYDKLYYKFCENFEFPKVYDEEARGKAAEHLIKTIPQEELKALIENAEMRGLLEGRIDGGELSGEFGVKAHRKGKRHYVRHGAGEQITFVRQQDLNLATENLRS